MGELNQAVYNVTDGRVSLQGRTTAKDNSGERVAQQIAEYASQGTKDRESNAFYDNSQRLERAMAVMSSVGYTYEEHVAQSTFRSTDWSAEEMQAHLSRIGLGQEAQDKAAQMMSNAQFVYLDGDHAGEDFLKVGDRVYHPDAAQMQQLQATGFCITGDGSHIGLKNFTQEQTSHTLQAAAAERDKTSSLFDTSKNSDMRQSLSEIASHQVRQISSFSAQFGISDFNGSKSQTKKLEDAVKNRISELENKRKLLSDSGQILELQKQIDQLKMQQKDIAIFQQTGAKADKGGTGAHSRSYGRSIIAQQFLGQDFYRGVQTYRRVGSLTAQSARLAVRTAANAMALPASVAAKTVGKVAKGTKAGTVADLAADKIKSAHGTAKEFTRKHSAAEKRQMRRDWHDKNRARSDAKLAKRAKRNDDRIVALDAKKRKGGLSEKESKRLQRANRRKDKYAKKGQKRIRKNEKRLLRRQRWSSWLKGIKESKVYKFLTAPFNLFHGANAILGMIRKKIFLTVGGFLVLVIIFMLLIGLAVSVPPVLVSFFGSAIDELMNINYTQAVVNDTANDLSKSFMDVAIKDAERHYLIDDPVSSSGLEWYKSVSDGKIVNVIAQEDTELFLRSQGRDVEQLSSVNANLLQITSMTHYRVADEIDFDNYCTAKAYMYYLYARSHDIVRDASGNPTYGYEAQPDHDANSLYTTVPYFDYSTNSVVRGDEVCENVYVHGYNTISFTDGTKYSAKINALRASAASFLTKTLQGLMAESDLRSNLVSDDLLKASGLWVNEVPCDAAGTCTNYTAMRGALNCSYCGHTHTEECFWTTDPATGQRVKKNTPQCSYATHAHSPWMSPSNPGCYDTYYLCKGHCGGHINPTVDVAVTMDWESLVSMDGVKITNPIISGSDFWHIDTANTIEGWRDNWIGRTNSYFSGFPNTPLSAKVWLGKNIFSSVGDLISGEDSEEKDTFDFEGWFLEDGTIDPTKIGDLNSIYGTRDTNFEEGVKCWKDFDVVFPAACGQPLTDDQITSVLEQVKASNPGISSRRLAVIEEALRGVGQYWYSCDANGHNNGLHNTSGPSECSGFVGGVLNRALGTSYSCSAAEYASYGTNKTKEAGDVIAHNRGGDGYTGHVMIYLGYLDEGIPGYMTDTGGVGGKTEQSGSGCYVIDCSSTYGGATFHKFSGNYPNAWGGY